jgi:hypothetical protein
LTVTTGCIPVSTLTQEVVVAYLTNILRLYSWVTPPRHHPTASCLLCLLSRYYESRYNDQWRKKADEVMRGAAGLPVGVQITTLPWRDELCLRVMKDAEQQLSYDPTQGILSAL